MAEALEKLKVGREESVQAVAAACHDSGEVSERYIRPEMDAGLLMADAEGYALPTIDMSRLLSPESSEEESAKLGAACEHWGFFQLVNHGVEGELLRRTKADVAAFFGLSPEEKSAVAMPPGGMQGFGHHFVFSEEQKLDWADLLFLVTRAVEERSLGFWPTNPSTFRDTLDKYTLELANVAEQLFRFMAKDQGVDHEALLGTFKGLPQCVRVNYYPPCRQADRVLGLSPHTDGVGMTLLLHVNDVQGLQIRKDGEWYPVVALPGALIVNIGDVLEILTNGKYKSIEHRAVVNPDTERITIAAFHSAHLSCTITRYKAIDGVALPSCICCIYDQTENVMINSHDLFCSWIARNELCLSCMD